MKFVNALSTTLLAVSTATAAATPERRGVLDGVAAGLANVASNGAPGQWACGLTQTNLNDLIDGYSLLLTQPGGPNFNATAARILAADFAVYSDSINTLSNRPLGGPSFPPGRAGFIASQFFTPPIPVLNTTDVWVGGYWNASSNPTGPIKGGNSWYKGNGGAVCSDLKVSWRWTASGIGANTKKVNGIIDLTLAAGAQGQDGLVIQTVYSEFNTAAWLQDLGVACAVPAQ